MDLDAGDAIGMYTAPCITVGCVGSPYHGAVCMAGDQDIPVRSGPFREFFFSPAFLFVVFCRTRGIQEAASFRRPPQLPHEEPAERP